MPDYVSPTTRSAAIAVATLAGAAVLGAIAPTAARAQTPKQIAPVIIVLDASGSMAARMGRSTRMAVAKDVLGRMVKGWDRKVKLGLIAYGHRRRNDCRDIQLIYPVRRADSRRVMAAVKRTRPLGKTPLTAAVRMAARRLNYIEDAATVILVTDGRENCAADPCALGKELHAKGANFTAHVIGFTVKKKDYAPLKCLAESTGGKFVTAGNAAELRRAIENTVKAAKAKPLPRASVRLRATLAPGGPVATRKIRWQLIWLDRKDGKRSNAGIFYKTIGNFTGRNAIRPGRYELALTIDRFRYKREITLKEGDNGTVDIVLNAGYVRFTARRGGAPIRKKIFWNVFRAGEKRQYDYWVAIRPLVLLPAGDYRVVNKYQHGDPETRFTVVAGKSQTVHVTLPVK